MWRGHSLPRRWFPPVGTGEASAYPPVRGFSLSALFIPLPLFNPAPEMVIDNP